MAVINNFQIDDECINIDSNYSIKYIFETINDLKQVLESLIDNRNDSILLYNNEECHLKINNFSVNAECKCLMIYAVKNSL